VEIIMPDFMQRQQPEPGQESVWDYPRPPRVEPTNKHIQIYFNGVLLADTTRAFRVLETSHPPVYYLPQSAIQMQYLVRTPRSSFCEFKGNASYWTIEVNQKRAENAGWMYANPAQGFEPIRDHIAFYAGKMDQCLVDDEVVIPQPGDFYGGWITSNIVGPFKGGSGTGRW
jgi:uncharacterized protein (DUF427 family)